MIRRISGVTLFCCSFLFLALNSWAADPWNLDISIKVVPILEHLSHKSLRFLGVPEDIRRIKENVLFLLNDGAGRVPCLVSIASATFTVESLVLVTGMAERYGSEWVLRVSHCEATESEKLNFDFRLLTVQDTLAMANLQPEIGGLEPVSLVGLLRLPEPETKKELLEKTPSPYDYFFLRDGTGEIAVHGKNPPGMTLSAQNNGYPIHVVGRWEGGRFTALQIITAIDLDSQKAVRFRLLNEVFRIRQTGFTRAR